MLRVTEHGCMGEWRLAVEKADKGQVPQHTDHQMTLLNLDCVLMLTCVVSQLSSCTDYPT
jgi:hypothetical protein